MEKTVVIVGAGPGIGSAVAREFAAHGFLPVLMARSAERLARYQREFREEGIEVVTKVVDAARPETLQTAIAEIGEELGCPDALVYNVGVTEPDGDREITGDLLVERFRVDVASAWDAARFMATDEFAAKGGAILLTGGGFAWSFSPIPFLVPLCIDKAALNALNIMLHDRLAPRGVFVGSVLVSGVVEPGDERYDPALVAKQYWKMYEERDEWQVRY
ncbi:3-oxoacyl-ACP reductase [Gordonibacter sp. An230]|uniref:SDR family NAD(P)-dependent oxidoreductase n=1 Tax=Gordonibacter sp. An230 TaxID=1965592 RepID=UPI000B397069|nr:SDR family NAD(P)-dependent oxidoreductase [Gordonibacter sp. An230]OUO89415.1 3-oxoacyl-ACP reductase [Gordonibacter sp. An230]